jgi:hypothetical protein
MLVVQHILMRYLVPAMTFFMVLVLTPKALVDSPESAGTAEIPVHMLEHPGNDCLWCTPPAPRFVPDCDDSDESVRRWLNPDDSRYDALPGSCDDDETRTSPSA